MWYKEYLPIKFKENGRDRRGCDCWGLVRLIYREKLGIELPSYEDEYSDTCDRKTISSLYKEEKNNWKPVPKGSEKEFDVAVFKMLGLPTHVGIVMGANLVLHCERGTFVHVTNYAEEPPEVPLIMLPKNFPIEAPSDPPNMESMPEETILSNILFRTFRTALPKDCQADLP